jgi:nitrogen fixation/metabolism regulation signal transduction histidine kinase
MTRELGDSKDRLIHAERVAAWQEIARGLAHELKNPLTPIQMSVETLRKTWTAQHPSFGEIFEESTHTVLEEVQRLKKIIGEFSQFARLPQPDRRECDLNEIVGGALALYRGAIKVVPELDRALPAVTVDRDQLTQVVLNLLENARDAIASKGSDESVGRIVVKTRGKAGAVELEVEDNGPGFEPTLKEKMFTPYYTTKQTGTGLGLAIVRRIVVEHGGRIDAFSAPGRGARFVVELPPRT